MPVVLSWEDSWEDSTLETTTTDVLANGHINCLLNTHVYTQISISVLVRKDSFSIGQWHSKIYNWLKAKNSECFVDDLRWDIAEEGQKDYRN